MKLQRGIAILALFCPLVFESVSADTLSLETVLNNTSISNSMALSARLMEKSAHENAKSVGKYSDPMLMLGIENLPTSGDFDEDAMTMRSIGFSWAFPYSGEHRLLREAANQEAEGATYTRIAEELSIARTAGYQFAEVRYLQTELSLMQTQLELATMVLSTANARYKSNQGGQDEVIMAQNDVWRMEAEVTSAKQMLSEEWRMLSAMTTSDPTRGESAPTLLDPHLDTIPVAVDAWIREADSANPRLRQLSARAEASRLTARASGRMKWPMLTLGTEYGFRAGYDMGADGMTGKRGDMMSFRADISLPIFSKKKNSQMEKAMISMVGAYGADSAQTARDLHARIRSLYDRAKQLIDQTRTYRDRVIPSGHDLVRVGLSGYSSGRVSLVSVLAYIQSSLSDQIALARIEKELTQTILGARELTGTLIIGGLMTAK
ncbi:MAG: TolC family protein [Candidatus Zixiibacteriota bacterium]